MSPGLAPEATESDETNGLDPCNPWPGLLPFTENDRQFFRGRDEEANALVRLVLNERVTVLYGVSGLGKTSLLHAGVFQRLRDEDIFPVPIRLAHQEQAPPYATQILEALRHAGRLAQVDVPDNTGSLSFWEYFHLLGTEFWTRSNHLVLPVLVFDQFEEIFRLDLSTTERNARLDAIADIIEDRVPHKVSTRAEIDPEFLRSFDFDRPVFKAVLSLREDFLPDLIDQRFRMPSIVPSRFRLRRMNGRRAMDVVRVGADLLEEGVDEKIIRFVGRSQRDQNTEAALEDLKIDPAILSLLCSELNKDRQRKRLDRIDSSLLNSRAEEVLIDFYRRSLQGLHPTVRTAIEKQLVNAKGYRESVEYQGFVSQPHVGEEAIQKLVDRRLLKIESFGDVKRVELAHDVLAPVVSADRALSEHRGKQIKALVATALLLILALGLMYLVARHSIRVHNRTLERVANEATKRNLTLVTDALDALLSSNVKQSVLLMWDVLNPKNKNAGSLGAGNVLAKSLKLLSPHAVHTFRNINAPVIALAVDPNGLFVAAAGGDGAVGIWDLASRKFFNRPPTGVTASGDTARRTISLTFDSTGRELLGTTADGRAWRWRCGVSGERCNWGKGIVLGGFRDGQASGIPKANTVRTIAFNPVDDQQLVFGSEGGEVSLWNVNETNAEPLAGTHSNDPKNRVYSVQFSQDGQYVAGAGSNNKAVVWDAHGYKVLNVLKRSASIFSTAFSPDKDSTYLLVAGADGARLWNWRRERASKEMLGHQGWVRKAIFGPQPRSGSGSTTGYTGQILIATVDDSGSLRVWTIVKGEPRIVALMRGHTSPILDVAFTPDGQSILTAGQDKTVRVWQISRPGRIVMRPSFDKLKKLWWRRDKAPLPGGIFAIARGPGESLVTSEAGANIRIWSRETPEKPGAKRGRILERHILYDTGMPGSPFAVMWRGICIAVAGKEGTKHQVKLWRPGTPIDVDWKKGLTEATQIIEVAGLVKSLSFDGAERQLAVAVGEEVKIYDVDSKTCTALNGGNSSLSLNSEADVNAVGFGWDSREEAQFLWAGTQQGGSRVWRREGSNGRFSDPNHADLKGHIGQVFGGSFGPNARRLVTSGEDMTARVWERSPGTNTWVQSGELIGHTDSVESAAFSDDGKLIVTGARDRTIRVWSSESSESFRELDLLLGHTQPVTSVGFVDGEVLSASHDGSAFLEPCDCGGSPIGMLNLALDRLKGELTDEESQKYPPLAETSPPP